MAEPLKRKKNKVIVEFKATVIMRDEVIKFSHRALDFCQTGIDEHKKCVNFLGFKVIQSARTVRE